MLTFSGQRNRLSRFVEIKQVLRSFNSENHRKCYQIILLTVRSIVTCDSRVSRAPPIHTLPAFLNLHGRRSIQRIIFMMAKRTFSILSDYCISQCDFYLINKDFRKQSVRRFYPANLEFPFLFCFLFSNSAVFTITDHKSLIHTCKNIIGKVRVTNHNSQAGGTPVARPFGFKIDFVTNCIFG